MSIFTKLATLLSLAGCCRREYQAVGAASGVWIAASAAVLSTLFGCPISWYASAMAAFHDGLYSGKHPCFSRKASVRAASADFSRAFSAIRSIIIMPRFGLNATTIPASSFNQKLTFRCQVSDRPARHLPFQAKDQQFPRRIRSSGAVGR